MEILNNLVRGYETDVLYLDYTKASDKVDNKILLLKAYLHMGLVANFSNGLSHVAE